MRKVRMSSIMMTSVNNNDDADDDKIRGNLEFILLHFQEPIFPRKIMTKDLGYQLEVFDKQEALGYFKSSRYEDCRINAYPPFTAYHGINRTPISFLMIDLDLKDFVRAGDSKKEEEKILEKALNKTLEKIKESIGGNPTVLWTGNGYHIYQPVSGGFIVEEYETVYEFTKYFDKDLTSLFIQFAEEYFTDYTADRLHNPYSIMKDWLDKCNKLEKLNFNAKVKIKEGVKSAQKGYFPISLEKLKEENKALYDIVVNKP
jgi:hypothetical protein